MGQTMRLATQEKEQMKEISHGGGRAVQSLVAAQVANKKNAV